MPLWCYLSPVCMQVCVCVCYVHVCVCVLCVCVASCPPHLHATIHTCVPPTLYVCMHVFTRSLWFSLSLYLLLCAGEGTSKNGVSKTNWYNLWLMNSFHH